MKELISAKFVEHFFLEKKGNSYFFTNVLVEGEKNMKKTFILLLFLSLLGIIEVKAATVTDQITSTFLGDYHYVYDDGKFGDFELFKRNSNQNIAYCIEPGVSRHKGDYTGYLGLSNAELALKAGISTTQLEKISLYAYYGYGYKNHTSTDWVVATQAKIWNVLGKNFQFTSKNYSPNPWQYVISTPVNIEEKFKELDTLIERHYTKPSFDWQTILIPYNEGSYILEDKNGILNEFEIKTSTNCTLKIENNNLIITPNKSNSEGVIYLVKKRQDWNQDIILFHHDTGQDLLATGDVKNVESTIVFKTITGKVKIQKQDQDTNKCQAQGEASLEDVEYTLYKEDGTKMKTVKLQNCEATITNLPLGNYYIKETKSPIGYKLDEKKYDFAITEQNITQEQTIIVKDEVYKTDLTIDKKYLTAEGLKPEANTKFAILNKKTGETLYTLITDEFGKINITLPYGEYIIKQLTGLENYYKSEDISLTVDEKTEAKTNIDLINEPYTSKVKVQKINSETNEALTLANIAFKIYDLKNEKYICQTSDCIFKTNEQGEFTTEDLFPSTYRLEEVKTNIPGYLWNEETITFTIDKNSPDKIELKFTNKRVKGKIKVQKMDTQKKPLKNVVFTLYAKEDIFENGKIVYYQNEQIDSFITNEKGEFETKLLPLGNYYIIETNPLDGYIPLKEPIQVSLTFQDSFTEIVEKNITVTNTPLQRGKLLIKKIDEKKNPLANVGFALYAKENIFENGKVIYFQNEKIMDFYTNEQGEFETDILPLGTYYIIETEPPNGYIPITEPIIITLTSSKKEEQIITKEIEIENEIYKVPNTNLNQVVIPSITVYLEGKNDEKKNKYFHINYKYI